MSDEAIRLKYSKGRTINTGNFESVRVDIGIELNCDSPEMIAETFDRMKKWVEGRLEAEYKRHG